MVPLSLEYWEHDRIKKVDAMGNGKLATVDITKLYWNLISYSTK